MTECPEQAVSVSHAVEVAAYTASSWRAAPRSISIGLRDVARSCK